MYSNQDGDFLKLLEYKYAWACMPCLNQPPTKYLFKTFN